MYIYIYIWVRLEIPYPHWEVCLGGMLRRYASGYASGVCFGVCFACTSSHGTYFISKRLPKKQPFVYLCVYPCRDVKYLTHAFKMCQGLEVEGLRYETGVIRV